MYKAIVRSILTGCIVDYYTGDETSVTMFVEIMNDKYRNVGIKILDL